MIYSPSSREEFSFCPRSWWLRKNGYTPRSVGYPELCAMGGNAVGKAMEVWNKTVMSGIGVTLEELVTVSQQELQVSFTQQQSYGRTIEYGKATEFFPKLAKSVHDAVVVLWETNPLKRYAILSAEEEFTQAGGARLDVRAKQPDGRQIVFDYKVKFGEVEEKWLNKEFEKHFTGEQRLTYTHLTQTDMFGIIMVILHPRKEKRVLPARVEVRTSPVKQEEQELWLRDALLMTPEMDHVLTIQAPEKVRGRTFPHGDTFGPCKYEDACFRYKLDPSLYGLDYIQIKKGVN